MFASTLFADENDVRDFDMQIQNLLRNGRADEAAAILETALGELGANRHPVAELCGTCPVSEVKIVGWDALAARIAELDTPDAPITGLGIGIEAHGHCEREPDPGASFEPRLETSFYHDGAFPLAISDRAALVEGYGPHGAGWQGGLADIDTLLGVQGLGALYGLVRPLVETTDSTTEPDPLDADAMRLGAAFIAVRLHQAVARAVRLHGLPRPLAVIVGSNETYPFYDAPVFSTAEAQDFAPVVLESAPIQPVAVEAMPVEQLPVEELAAEELAAEELAAEELELEDLTSQPETGHDDEPRADKLIDLAALENHRVVQISGAALRQRLGQQQAAEQAAASLVATAGGGLLRRLFSR